MTNYDWATDFAKSPKNKEVWQSHASQQHVLTMYPDGKIYDYNALDGKPSNKIKDESWLVDTNALISASQAKKEGEVEKYASIMDTARSDLYKELLVAASQQEEMMKDNEYISPARLLLTKHDMAAAGGTDGQILQTAQEIVRQTKYQTKVTGVFYREEKYQAVHTSNPVSIEGLTTKAALDTQLPVGHSEIGDDVTPVITRPEFEVFEKQIFADSFHYGFGMREKDDAFFNIEQRMTMKVPGLMLKLRNDKMVNLLNSATHTTPFAIGATKWDTYSAGGVVTHDAGGSLDGIRLKIEDFEGDEMFLAAPYNIIRAYLRNVEGHLVKEIDSRMPATGRTGSLPYSQGVTYRVENAMTANSAVLGSKVAWADAYTGPQVDIAYKDDKKPSAWEGRLLFHFNGVQRKLSAAAQRFMDAASTPYAPAS